MKYFVEFVVSALVDKPDEVEIEQIDSEARLSYRINVSPADVGRVIGRKGRTINAIRNVLGAVTTDRRHVQVEVSSY